jgi:UDP-N-acetylmuramate dehydrogenase
MTDAALLRALEGVATLKRDEPLSRHTTIGIGGPSEAYVVVSDAAQLRATLHVCAEASAPVFMLGSGSNIVVGDRGIPAVVIDNKATALSEPARLDSGAIKPSSSGGRGLGEGATAEAATERFLIRADAGASFAQVSRHLSFAGLAGLEWACGIPGTIGGAVVYNAGAYGGCLGDILQRIAVFDPDAPNAEQVIEASDLGLVYRGSAFTRGLMAGRSVLWAEFALWPCDEAELRARIADYDARRLKAQPRGRNAGSFFKNPPDHPAWRLLDSVGMRGYQVGGAQFSDKHCNFLINTGNATAADVASLMHEAQRRVREQHGIELQNEVTLVGEGFGDD